MAIRKIARLGHPVLRQKTRDLTPSEIASPEIARLIQDMVETMHEYGGIGLAAPQIHESLNLAIIELGEDNPRYPNEHPAPISGVFINPKITILDSTPQGFWEGCLSVPELRGFVKRPRKIQVDYLDASGKSKKIVAEDFLATVFQHELDHLSGIVFIDRIEFKPGESPLAFTEEYSRYIAPRRSADEGELAD